MMTITIGKRCDRMRSFCSPPFMPEKTTNAPIAVRNAEASNEALLPEALAYLQDVATLHQCQNVRGWLYQLDGLIPDVLLLDFPNTEMKNTFVGQVENDTEKLHFQGRRFDKISPLTTAWQIDVEEFFDASENSTQIGIILEEVILALPAIPIMREMRKRFAQLLHTTVTLSVLQYHPPEKELSEEELAAWEEKYKNRVEMKSVGNHDLEFIAALQAALDATGKDIIRFQGSTQIWCPSPLLLATLQKLDWKMPT